MSHYREGFADLELDNGFFRTDSILSRDLSVLTASLKRHESKSGRCGSRWLDLMAGCGIRSIRWVLESEGNGCLDNDSLSDLQIWVNDANLDRFNLIKKNLHGLQSRGVQLQLTNELAEVFLAKASLEKCFFDLIDVDCFGSPNSLLPLLIRVLAFDGILMLSSSDGRSPTGHDRLGAIRSLSASARSHPASWEMALRLQLGFIARQFWALGKGIEPLFCFSDGRTFRVFVRMKRNLSVGEEKLLGFVSRCEVCGAQDAQSLLSLKRWETCQCKQGLGKLSINGPLWIGPLQSPETLEKVQFLEKTFDIPIVNQTQKLINRLKADQGVPVFSWSTHELAQRAAISEPLSVEQLIDSLRSKGFIACRNSVVPGQIRTDAPIEELLLLYKS